MKALFDTPILEAYLRGKPEAKRVIESYEVPVVSAVSVAALLAEAAPEEMPIVQAWLGQFTYVTVDGRVAELAAKLKHHHEIALDVALIWASAKAHHVLLVTDDPTRYPFDEVGVKKAY